VCISQVIAISNQKGGVGKTTTAMNLAVCMARHFHRVLLIDLDPQANLSKAWGIEESQKNVYSLILEDVSYEEAMISLTSQPTPVPKGGLHILPGSSNFPRYEKLRAGEVNSQFDLKKVLVPIKDEFDYIIMDCPPALGLITVNALACAAHVLVPMEAQLFAMEGLEGICDTIKKLKEFINLDLALLGVFLCAITKGMSLTKEWKNL
jgi:chromosome partitioning protein